MATAPAWKREAIAWAKTQRGKHLCACGCGRALSIRWYHKYSGVPTTFKGHHRRMQAKVRLWIEENQGKHECQCGCGGFIEIKIHHHVRGIPKFINGHYSRVANPMLGRYGDKNPNYSGGRHIDGHGYVQVLISGPGRSKYTREHRLVAAKKVGRKLRRNEDVHHDNRKKTDNHPDNLEVMSKSEHSKLHAISGESGFRLMKKRGAKPWWRKKTTT
jgi:hypothetical protein